MESVALVKNTDVDESGFSQYVILCIMGVLKRLLHFRNDSLKYCGGVSDTRRV